MQSFLLETSLSQWWFRPLEGKGGVGWLHSCDWPCCCPGGPVSCSLECRLLLLFLLSFAFRLAFGEWLVELPHLEGVLIALAAQLQLRDGCIQGSTHSVSKVQFASDGPSNLHEHPFLRAQSIEYMGLQLPPAETECLAKEALKCTAPSSIKCMLEIGKRM